MTTTITVKASHGWPVRVSFVNPADDRHDLPPVIVSAGKHQDFVCHSVQDLHIHEIQPGEPDFDPPADVAD